MVSKELYIYDTIFSFNDTKNLPSCNVTPQNYALPV